MGQERSRPLRADARKNQERILDAAIDLLGRDPGASVADIAGAAGVGRVTLYGHFSSRDELVEATLSRVLERGDEVLAALDLSGDSRDGLARLIEASWELTAKAGAVLDAAREALPAARVQELHSKPMERALALLERGQAAGELRSDLPPAWMASALHHLIKGAALDAARGVLDPSDVPGLIISIALPAFSATSSTTAR